MKQQKYYKRDMSKIYGNPDFPGGVPEGFSEEVAFELSLER